MSNKKAIQQFIKSGQNHNKKIFFAKHHTILVCQTLWI